MVKVDYIDENGIQRRVLLKTEYESPEKGIPLDVYSVLNEFYADTNDNFRKVLYETLWAMGLIEPHHFQAPDARKKFRQALQSSLSRDATDAIRYIMRE